MLESRLIHSENSNSVLNNDRERLKDELDGVMFELDKAKMSSSI